MSSTGSSDSAAAVAQHEIHISFSRLPCSQALSVAFDVILFLNPLLPVFHVYFTSAINAVTRRRAVLRTACQRSPGGARVAARWQLASSSASDARTVRNPLARRKMQISAARPGPRQQVNAVQSGPGRSPLAV
eukprot:6181714-Pleurochrysis_carterae.AAC.1